MIKKLLLIDSLLLVAMSFILVSCLGGGSDSSPTSSDGGRSDVVDSFDGNGGGGGNSGTGGSLARFTIKGEYMYTVDHSTLKVFDLSDPGNPVYIGAQQLGNDIETIFSLSGLLFIGSETGMFIYSIEDPRNPVRLSRYEHVESCDPVVANSTHAYVTLRTGQNCWRGVNQLEVLDVTDPTNPVLIGEYAMENPKGLALRGDLLYVCDGGIKIMDISDPLNLKQVGLLSSDAFDLIALDNSLIAIGEGSLSQYSYDGSNLTLISRINL